MQAATPKATHVISGKGWDEMNPFPTHCTSELQGGRLMIMFSCLLVNRPFFSLFI